MATAKIAITLDEEILDQLDRWVREARYPSRSNAIQAAVKERLARWKRTRLVEELAKLDPDEEKALADEGLRSGEGTDWPEY